MNRIRTPNAAREKDPRLATKKPDPTTPRILERWAAGVPAEAIAAEAGKTTRAVQLLASYHKVRRPAWYLSAIRGMTSVAAQRREVAA
jgi:hypothetical protein